MASREKKTLVPSKSKQKAVADVSVVNDSKAKKGKALNPNPIAIEVFEALVSDSKHPPTVGKLPRHKTVQRLPRKALASALKNSQKVKTAKATLLKAKQQTNLQTVYYKRVLRNTTESRPKSEKTSVKKIVNNIRNAKSDKTSGSKIKVQIKKEENLETEKDEDSIKIKSPTKSNKRSPQVSPRVAKAANKSFAKKGIISKRSLSKELETLQVNRSIKQEPQDQTYNDSLESVIASMKTEVEEDIQVREELLLMSNRAAKEGSIESSSRRSLRSGRLRQSLDSTVSSESDRRIRKSETPTMSDSGVDTSLEKSTESKSSDSSVAVKAEDKTIIQNHSVEVKGSSGVENNNNRAAESLAAAMKSENIKLEEDKISSTMEGDKKIRFLPKPLPNISNRRSSFNLINANEIKKACSGFFKNEKPDSSAAIDLMIDKIKLDIAKSIESKIFNKNFELPKVVEIVAPQNVVKLENDETTSDEKIKLLKKEMKLESADDSVPKVADTAKEIEKLVMGESSELGNLNETKDNSDCKVADVVIDTEVFVESQNSPEQSATPSTSALDAQNKVDNVERDVPRKIEPGESLLKINIRSFKSLGPLPGPSTENLQSLVKKEISLPATTAVVPQNNEIIMEITEAESSEFEDTSIENILVKPNENKTEQMEISLESKEIDDEDPKLMEVTESCDVSTRTFEEELEKLEKFCRDVENESESVAANADERLNVPVDNIEKNKTKSVEAEPLDKSDVEMIQDLYGKVSLIENATIINPTQLTKKGCDESSKDMNVKSNKGSKNIDNLKSPIEMKVDSVFEENCRINTVVATINEEVEEIVDEKIIEKVNEKINNAKVTAEKEGKDKQFTPEVKRRVLRTRDKQKKGEVKAVDKSESTLQLNESCTEEPFNSSIEIIRNSISESKIESEENDETEVVIKKEPEEKPEFSIRTRRSREVKRPSFVLTRPRRSRKQDLKKNDSQHKEDSLLDKEVAKLTDNNLPSNRFNKSINTERGVSVNGKESPSLGITEIINRSKSENDVSRAVERKNTSKSPEESKMEVEIPCEKNEEVTSCNSFEQRAIEPNEPSTSGLSSKCNGPKVLLDETPEDRAKKEKILRLLGLESTEKAIERLKAKNNTQSSGTLKTIIRVNTKEKDNKKRSRSPLKMVIKPNRKEGEESSNSYTIQKEPGTSKESSHHGANRKLSNNHRQSCDEDKEEAPPKDRQSLVIPEKASSFDVHPERLCFDVCCYCFGKFGSLDTPLHLATMKNDERMRKILNNESHLCPKSCLCDACYRHVDRKANMSPTNIQSKPQRQHRQLMAVKCQVPNCRETSRHYVKKHWLLKIKHVLGEKELDWDNAVNSLSFCVTHYRQIQPLLHCAVCKRRLARNGTFQLLSSEIDELNEGLQFLGIPVSLDAQKYVCKLCRYFTSLQLKFKDLSTMNDNYRQFFKSYRIRILHYHDIEVVDENQDDELLFGGNVSLIENTASAEEQSNSTTSNKGRRKSKPIPQTQPSKPTIFNNQSVATKSNETKQTVSNKVTPDPESIIKSSEKPISPVNTPSEVFINNMPRIKSSAPMETTTEIRNHGLESTIEKLKKRKALTALGTETITTATTSSEKPATNDVVEILAMDREVTLTRLPKKPKLNTANSDIPPVVQRLGANPSISVRTLFPGEEEMNLQANIDFNNVREVTPLGWEKSSSVIQYDRETKLLWQELQRPYGNQSSFLRHLILLEKYYRSGDLVLAPNASRSAINYSTSVQNRLISYEGPEKMEEALANEMASTVNTIPVTTSEFANPNRLSGGIVVERERIPSVSNTIAQITATSSSTPSPSFISVTSQLSKLEPSTKVLKLTPGVSIIKKPPPNLQRLPTPTNGSAKRKDTLPIHKTVVASGPKTTSTNDSNNKKVTIVSKKQKTFDLGKSLLMINQIQQAHQQAQFQKHLQMQQEMLNRQTRSEFEPIVCDARSLLVNSENSTPAQNLLNSLNLPKSIQVTTKPIPILPKLPKSLTVIPQTAPRPTTTEK